MVSRYRRYLTGKFNFACLFPEHRRDPYNKRNHYNNRKDADNGPRFKNPFNNRTTAKAHQQQQGRR
jgi:hypothetical protein